MGRLIIWNIMSLDGAFEGAAPWDLSMHETVWGPELEQLSKQQLAEAPILLFGRKTYEGMAEYWRDEKGEIAEAMNKASKAVVSATLKSADWNNSRLLRSDRGCGRAQAGRGRQDHLRVRQRQPHRLPAQRRLDRRIPHLHRPAAARQDRRRGDVQNRRRAPASQPHQSAAHRRRRRHPVLRTPALRRMS